MAIPHDMDDPAAAPSVFPGFAEMDADVRHVVAHLSEYRRSCGLSQTEIAARMKTSQSAVARLEAGHGDVRLSTLQRYSHALGHAMCFGVAPLADEETRS